MKSQSSIEFVIFSGVIFLFITIFLIALQENTLDRLKDEKRIIIQNIAESVQDEISLATSSSEGYYRKFTIPEKIYGIDYTANIVEGVIYIKTMDEKYAIALPIHNITGQINKSDNIIKKEGGIVYLNP